MKSKSSTFWGIIIIAIGLFVLGDKFGPRFYFAGALMHLIVGGLLILYGVNEFFQRKLGFLPFFAFYTGLGFLMFTWIARTGLMWRLSDIDSPWSFIGPAALLALGTSMLLKNIVPNQYAKEEHIVYKVNDKERDDNLTEKHFTETADTIDVQDLFNSSVIIATSKAFQGGFISSRFSETSVHLKQIELVQDAILTIDSAFSSVRLTVPKEMKVSVRPVKNIISSIKEYGEKPSLEASYQLVINVDVKFGSVEIHYV